jgi:hypothetical protein
MGFTLAARAISRSLGKDGSELNVSLLLIGVRHHDRLSPAAAEGKIGAAVSESDRLFTGSIAEVNDTYLVPLIFEQYATDLAKRTAALAPEAVLEIAAGSGVVTRGITSMLEPGTRHAVTDLNPPMLEMAASKQPSPGSMDGCGPSSSRHAERKSPCQALVAQPM